MRNAVVLPRSYEAQLIYEARKCGLAEKIYIDIPDALSPQDEEELDKQLYARKWSERQKIFQIVLLFDEIIVPGIDPTNDYQGLAESGYFSFSSIDDYFRYATENNLYENCIAVSSYLKPALMPILLKKLTSSYNNDVKGISKRKFAENIYDAVFTMVEKGKLNFSPKMCEAFEKSEIRYDLSRKKIYESFDFPEDHKDFLLKKITLWTYLCGEIQYEYEYLNMLLDYANSRNANIINCEYQLAKIGCENTDISNMLTNYATIRLECKNIIGTLPRMNSLKDVLELKDKRHKEIFKLRQVLTEFENTVRHSGKRAAIEKVNRDIQLAVKDLNNSSSLFSKIGTWTTMLSVPVTVAEAMLHSPPIIGLPIGLLGTAALVDSKIKEKNNWVHIMR